MIFNLYLCTEYSKLVSLLKWKRTLRETLRKAEALNKTIQVFHRIACAKIIVLITDLVYIPSYSMCILYMSF